MTDKSRKRFFTLLFTLLALIMTACSGTTTLKPSDEQAPLENVEAIQQAIYDAESLPIPARYNRFIELAKYLKDFGETETAINLVERINSNKLDDPQFIEYSIITSQLFIDSESLFRSSKLLNNERLDQLWSTMSPEQQQSLYRQKALTFSLLGNTEQSIENYILLDALLTDPLDITANHEVLWQELIKLSVERLTTLEKESPDYINKGWFQLALISKSNESDLEIKYREITTWTRANPLHPATAELPLDLQLLTTLIDQRPTKVALLLPFDGKLAIAGKTIRDGFFAAYFNNQKAQQYKPQVKLYDTSTSSIEKIYQQAITDGADMVVGPLQKENVARLQAISNRPVPTLALNYSNQSKSDPEIEENAVENKENRTNPIEVDPLANTSIKPVYQFGLSLEDESVQAADRAWLEGHRYAMVIASSADWSRRAADAFARRWQSKGGRVVVDKFYGKGSSYSDTIKSAFAINESENRARRLKRLFGQNFEFEPRPRQDIDMIFLVARSSEGQQIKPTLAFHYAGKIPVYATSQIFSSSQTASKNRDLNGIRFTTLPWTLKQNNSKDELIQRNLKIPPNYERLYAMGADAYLLHDRLKQLARIPNTSLYGSTGKLRLNNQYRIIREQPWAEIVKGEAQALPYLTENKEDL
jgi:outer membrane PBP1 activator LpoA protein